MFYVIDKTTGKLAIAEGFWAISENGRLYDVIDGWNCEGGGGSSIAPGNLVAVFGEPEPEPAPEPEKFSCEICSKSFTTKDGRNQHKSMKHFVIRPSVESEAWKGNSCRECGGHECNGQCFGDDMMGASS